MSINRGMDREDVVSMYNGILLSSEKEWNIVNCSNMDVPRDITLSEVKSEKDKYPRILLICGILKRVQMDLSIRQK